MPGPPDPQPYTPPPPIPPKRLHVAVAGDDDDRRDVFLRRLARDLDDLRRQQRQIATDLNELVRRLKD